MLKLRLPSWGLLLVAFAFSLAESHLHPDVAWAQESAEAVLVTYVGFQELPDGQQRVFVRLSKAPELTESSRAEVTTVRIANARIVLGNNRNPLETRFFSGPLAQARLKQEGADVALILKFRSRAVVRKQVTQRPDGSATLSLDLVPSGGA